MQGVEMTFLSKITVNAYKYGFLRMNRSLSAHDQQNVKQLIMRMKNETTSTGNEYSQKLSFISKVDNGEMKFCTVPLTEDAFISFDNMKNLTIDINKTSGRITNYKKPLFMSWGKIIKQISKNLDDIMSNYSNEQTIKKGTMSMFAMTEKGAKRIQEAQEKVFGHIL